MPLLQIDNLRCSVRTGSAIGFASARKQVLQGVSLAIEEGITVALLGESGSGKTTLARCIVGLQKADSGSIAFDGINIFPQTEKRKHIGIEIQMLFQGSSASLDPSMTVLESLAEGIEARVGRSPKTIAKAEELISSVGLSKDCLGRLPSQLSGGQRQRVALARVLSVTPRLLVLDEPTSALDVLTSAHMLHLLKSMRENKGLSYLFITHDVQTALSFCDRVAVLYNGVIVEEGLSREVHEHPLHEYTHQLMQEGRLQ